MAAITHFRVSGWMPFAGDFVLELPQGPIAVVARYLSNPRRSNMAGKTALMEAITWALFGVHRKRLDDEIIHGDLDECSVELRFGDLEVIRTKKRGSSTVLTVRYAAPGFPTGQETLRMQVAQDFLLEHLALGFDDYQATVNFAQGDIESLVAMRTGKRREIISGWLRLERWAEACRKATDASRAAQIRLQTLQHDYDVALLSEEDAARASDDLEQATGVIAHIRDRLPRIDENLRALGDPDAIATQIQELGKLRSQATEMRTSLLRRPMLQAEHETAAEHVRKAQIALESARRRRREIMAIRTGKFDGRCPITCGACPVADDVARIVAKSEALVQQAEEAMTTTSKAATEATVQAARAARVISALDAEAGAFTKVVERGRDLVAAVGTTSLEDVEAARERVDHLRAERGLLESELLSLTRQEAELKAKLTANARSQELRADRERQRLLVERELRVTSIMVQALGPAGVPARIAKTYVSRLEQSVNELLADSGLSLEFAWGRPTKELVAICAGCGFIYTGQRDKTCPACGIERTKKMADELEILVNDGVTGVEDVKMKSGGARVLVASALRLTASAMLRDVRGTPVGWATIDEPFGPLDAENREHLARVFGGMLGSVGLEQAFVVSHDVALLDALPHRILIERDDAGVSTVRMEES